MNEHTLKRSIVIVVIRLAGEVRTNVDRGREEWTR